MVYRIPPPAAGASSAANTTATSSGGERKPGAAAPDALPRASPAPAKPVDIGEFATQPDETPETFAAKLAAAGFDKLDDAKMKALDLQLKALAAAGKLEDWVENTMQKVGFKRDEILGKKRYITDAIHARLDLGTFTGALGTNDVARSNLSWKELNAVISAAAAQGPAGTGVNQQLFDKLEGLTGQKFVPGNLVTPLIDGPASFAEKYKAIDAAKQSIYISSWKVYGDGTGQKLKQALLEKHAKDPHVDIRIMVDGNVADQDPAARANLKELIDNGIPVMFVHNDERRYEGFHYKDFVVDGATANPMAINGGMNWGNEYSHGFGTAAQFQPETPRWRDTDAKIEGPGARTSYDRFVGAWNAAVGQPNSVQPSPERIQTITKPSDMPSVELKGKTSTLQVVDVPGPTNNQGITKGIVAMIHAAKTSVDVEHAYVMESPAIHDAIVQAAKRGVTVRVLTNSPQTIDETIVAAPNRREVKRLLTDAEQNGIAADKLQIYERTTTRPQLKNVDTLHTKMILVDGQLMQLGSYNIHARSMRLETEGSEFFNDASVVKKYQDQFGEDLKQARRVNTSAEAEIPFDKIDVLMHKLGLPPVNL